MLPVERVHPDAVAEERPARPRPRRVHGEDRDANVWKVGEQAPDEFVGERALSRAAGAGDADDGD